MKLNADPSALHERYVTARPFPHIVLDGLFPDAVLEGVLADFPRPEEMKARFDNATEKKLGYTYETPVRDNIRDFLWTMSSAPVLQFLEALTGIEGLIPDPYFNGGGYHETGRGGKLGIHADFRVNEQLHLHRRINVIIYLNEHWDESYGGSLELWSRDMTMKCEQVAPVFNRCVIFNTDATSYHGHPDPLTTPEGVYRRSIALYYYTASKEIYNEVPNVSTMYRARPEDDRSTQREASELRLDQHLRQWVPPALQRYVFAAKRRLRGR